MAFVPKCFSLTDGVLFFAAPAGGKMNEKMKYAVAIVALLCGFAGSLLAQGSGSGQITGTVRDPN